MHESEERLPVPLPAGMTEVSASFVRPAGAVAIAGIAHGAGATASHPFYLGFARALNAANIATVRFAFPYSEAGRRMPGPAAHATATWAAVSAFATTHAAGLPFWATGKSYGGRMGSLAAAEGLIAPAGLVYLGYPLHPPGEPTKPRVAHLPRIAAPQLFVQGRNDPFATPNEQLEVAVAHCQDAHLVWIDDANHSFEVKGNRRAADRIGEELAPLIAAFITAAR